MGSGEWGVGRRGRGEGRRGDILVIYLLLEVPLLSTPYSLIFTLYPLTRKL
jgi:hypothetical protein